MAGNQPIIKAKIARHKAAILPEACQVAKDLAGFIAASANALHAYFLKAQHSQ